MLEARSSLEAALGDRPWALTGVVLGIEHVHDVNGRPLGERRAPAEARRGVPNELIPCPYHDERHGRPMNKSALEPTMRSFAAVLAEVSAFHAALAPAPPSWPRMLAAVLDQLVAPARYLLEQRSTEGPVPADLAAGHKLAAGYFGTLRRLLREDAAGPGAAPDPSSEGFARFVRERGALIGASEVCAGPAHNIHVLTRLFLDGVTTPGVRRGVVERPVSAERLQLAHVLAAQVQLSVVYEVMDELTERRVLLEVDGTPRALPTRTAYLSQRLADRAAELLALTPPRAHGLDRHLPALVEDPELRAAAAAPMAEPVAVAEAEPVMRLLESGEAAVVLSAPARQEYALRFATLLRRHRLFIQAQWRLERLLRRALGYSTEVGFRLNATLCPRPRALEWFDVFTGHRLSWVAGEAPVLTARNHHREVTLG